MTSTSVQPSSTRGLSLPSILLHLEGLTVFLTMVTIYINQHYDGLTFLLLLFAPDLAILGYKVNARVGSLIYNAVHTYAVPVLLLAARLWLAPDADWLTVIALIWMAHIGMDRTLGFGLKYPTVFKDTHFSRI